jgi:predicted dehydrogenase
MARTIRWGILGAGRVSQEFAHSLELVPEARIAAVASRTRARAESLAGELGARAYADLAAFFADPDIDIVYVATPAGLHEQHALGAIASGKAVLCEKPFATDAASARRIASAAREARVFCMEAMWMRFVPLVRELKELIERGEIGDVRLFQAELGFAIPYREGSRYYDPTLGGGALLDLGVYPLSLAFYLLGLPSNAHAFVINDHGVDEQMCVTLQYPNALAQLTCTFANRTRNDACVIGSAGRVEIDAPLYAPTAMTVTREGANGPPDARAAPSARPRWEPFVDQRPRLVELRRRLTPTLKPLVRRNQQRITRHFPGFGYQFEAREAMRCMWAGELESPLMPLGETVTLLEVVDRLRASAT